jgi:uncharacterized damage-inducible protein DinB
MKKADMKEDERYPIGPFAMPDSLSEDERLDAITDIAETPEALREAVTGLDEEQLDTPYREGGWTVRQLVHHVADSHLNSFIRFKMGLTEDVPTICVYNQDRWATTSEISLPIEVSVELLTALHLRWTALMRTFSQNDWNRRINHPEWGKITLEQLLALYSWHGRHHVAQIMRLRENKARD